MNIKLILNKCHLYQLLANKIKKYTVKKNPIVEINRCYKMAFGRLPNLDDPKDLIEKIFWMELNTDTSLWSNCSDKYLMRDYIIETGYGEYLPKFLAKWDKAEDIDFSALPEEFIMKTNNGCGTCYVVKNKETENIQKVKKLFKHWLKIEHGYANAQLHYLDITPCIIAEELLHQSEDEKLFSPKSLVDYKIWCFKGQPECILVVYNRDIEHTIDLYDTKWNRMPDKMSKKRANLSVTIPKPQCLDEMLRIASGLSKNFPEVRVDFYVIDGKPLIGELTFSAGYGSLTNEYYLELGSKVDLSGLEIIQKTRI